jgi:hypothetical protein
MKGRQGTSVLLIILISGVFGCAALATFTEGMRNNEVVLDAWARGQRAEARKDYERAKEEYYFVKRFATTYYLQTKAQERYEAMSRILEGMGEE